MVDRSPSSSDSEKSIEALALDTGNKVNITVQDLADASDKDETSDVEDEEDESTVGGAVAEAPKDNLSEKLTKQSGFDLTSQREGCLEFRQGLFRCTKVLLTTVQLQV
jgi:hypothetical protein